MRHLRLIRQLHTLLFVNSKPSLYLHKFKGRKLDGLFQVISYYRSLEGCNHPTTTNGHVYWISLDYLYTPKTEKEISIKISTCSMEWMMVFTEPFQRNEQQNYNIYRYLQLSTINNSSWASHSWISLVLLLLKHPVTKSMNNALKLHIGTPIEKTLLCHGAWRRS